MKTQTKIYCFSQQCSQAGCVVPATKLEDYRAGQDDQSEDIFEFASGTEAEIVEEARKMIAGPFGFNWKCAKQVLAHLGESATAENEA